MILPSLYTPAPTSIHPSLPLSLSLSIPLGNHLLSSICILRVQLLTFEPSIHCHILWVINRTWLSVCLEGITEIWMWLRFYGKNLGRRVGRTGGESGFECLSLCITNASLMKLIKFPLMKAVLMINYCHAWLFSVHRQVSTWWSSNILYIAQCIGKAMHWQCM